MTENSQTKNWYLSLFKDFEARLNGERSKPVHALRRAAMDRFAQIDFPSLRDEEWRFTDISPLLKHSFSYSAKKEGMVPSRDDISRFLFGGFESHVVVFVNGFYSGSLSRLLPLPKGVVIGSLAESLKEDDGRISAHLSDQVGSGLDAFTALNLAFTLDGLYINVPGGAVVDRPVHALFVSAGDEKIISQPRNLIVAGKNSQIRLIEHYVTLRSGEYFTNSVTDVVIEGNAVVDTVRLQSENLEAYHVATTTAFVHTNGTYESHAVSNGASIYRHNLNVALNGEGASTTLEGLYLTAGDQLSDTHSMIDHAAPNCTSGEHYKGILDGNSRAVFNGKIMVRQGAQKTSSYQENRNIILSEEAKVDTKPQLEIFADDVKCSHGATVGQLSKESLFYLKSRGIGEEQAKLILIYAFASDVLKNIKEDEVRVELEKVLSTRFLKGI